MTERVRILHVDNDPEFVDLAATALERERTVFSVDTTASAAAGLDRLADTDYDCIVSDYDMPGMSGTEFLESVRETAPDLPFVLFTGEGSEEVASEAIRAGVTDYLQKGGSSEQYTLLANRVESAVSAYRTAQRATLHESLTRHVELVGKTGGWEVDALTGALHCTAGTRDILGVDEDQAPDSLSALVAFYHPEDQPKLRATVERARVEAVESAGEWRLRTADGDRRCVEMTVHPVEENGTVVALRGVLDDITERHTREQQPHDERSFSQQAVDALDVPVCVLEPDGQLCRWNSTLTEVTGYTDDQLAGGDLAQFVAPPDRDQLAGAIEAALQDGQATVAANLQTVDGAQVPCEFTGSRLTDSDGEPTGLVGVCRHRTDCAGRPGLAEMALRHSPDPAVLVDVTDSTEFRINTVNPAYEELTGLDADQLTGRRPGAAFGGESGERIDAQYRNCIEQQRQVEYTECRPVNGESREWETKLAPVIRDGAVVALVGTTRDVTEHKRRESDLERYEHLVESLPVGVFRATTDGEFLSVNKALVSLCDAGSRAALRTAGVEALYAEPSHRQLLLDQLTEKGVITDKLLRIETLGGDTRWVELSLSLFEEGGSRYIDGTVRDVTEHDRHTPGAAAFTLLDKDSSDPLFLVDVDDRLRLRHIDTVHEDLADDVVDPHSGELATPDGDDSPALDASRAEQLRECVRTCEPQTFEGVSPLTGNPVDGTARVVPVVIGDEVEYLVGLLDRDPATDGLLRTFADLTTDTDSGFAETLGTLLERGREQFGADRALFARTDPGENGPDGWTVARAAGDGVAVRAGPPTPLSAACCRRTADGGVTTAADADADAAGSYIGAAVTVDGDLYGTLCFVADEPRAAFTDRERDAVALLSRWVGDQLERERLADLFERTQEHADIGAWEYNIRTDSLCWTAGLSPEHDPPAGCGRAQLLEQFHPTDRERLRAAFQAAVENGESLDARGRLEPANGGRRWVRVRGGPADQGGETPRLRGTVQDITARTERDRDLQATGDSSGTASDALVLFEDGDLLYASTAVGQVYGLDRERLRAEPSDWTRHVHPDDSKTVPEFAEAAVTEPVEGTVRVQHPERGLRWVAMTAYPVRREDGPACTVCVGTDVTGQLLPEQRLERYERFIETMDNTAFVVDADWTVDYVNTTLTEHVDSTPGEIRGQSVMQFIERFVPEESRGRFEQALESVFEGERGSDEQLELDLDLPTGPAVFEYQFSPLVEDGDVTAVAVTARELTAHREWATALAEKNERLDRFTSILDHDLRSPLSAAVGYRELAAGECSPYLDDIERAHDRIETLIETLLMLAHEGETVQSREPVALRDVSTRCWQTVGTEAATVDIETDRVVQADPSRIQQLFENLYRNAVEHGGEAVTITVGELDDGFYVEDDGPGIAAAERGRVLEMGYSSMSDSTGFGLSIVERVTEAHGWTVHVTEGSDGGARFEFTGTDRPAPEC